MEPVLLSVSAVNGYHNSPDAERKLVPRNDVLRGALNEA